ncbi:MAG: aldehyde dehydrogenase family protein [Inhella sp.]
MQFRSLIGGRWWEGGRATVNENPSDLDDPVGTAYEADAEAVHAAVNAAAAAAPAWGLSGPQQRFDVLDRVGSEILARREELGRLLAREEGKTLPEAIGEVGRAGQIFKFFAGEALRQGGQVLDSVRPGVGVEVRREPLGVVGLITPWNFPIAIPAWKVAPALAYGNAVVLKPAERVPGSAWALADILHRSGLPEGVFNLVLARGSVVGPILVERPEVAAISFTGSEGVGRRLAADCGLRLKKLQLEMGGKNPLLVLDDAELDQAVNCAIQGAFYSTGQRCTASSRLIVTAGIAERFAAALRAATEKLVVGHALEAGTQIGPVVDGVQLESVERELELARQDGARLICGGQRVVRATQGHFLQPALLEVTRPGMRADRVEVFGPVATLAVVKDYEAGLALANDTEFGLAAGICTTSLKHAQHFKRHAQAGMVMVNLPTAGVDYHVPFGGRKGSSFGPREQGAAAAEFYTTVKTAYQCA